MGAGCAGSIILCECVRSSAYLPLPVAIAVAADQWKSLSCACVVAFALPFAGTLLALRIGDLVLPDHDPFGYKKRLQSS